MSFKRQVSFFPNVTVNSHLDLFSTLQEEDEARAQFNKNKQYASFQLRQAEIKARRKAAAKIEELQEVAQIQMSLREQEQVFRQYADEWLDEYRRQGKSTAPLELNLNRKATFSMGTMS